MLEACGDSVWCHEQRIRFGGLPLWHRMTVVRLAGGGLLVHSPTRLDAELTADLRRNGAVVAIVAPSWWHDLYLEGWLAAFPAAELYAAPTLVRWRPALPVSGVLTNVPPSLWEGDLEQHWVQGIGLFLDEVVFHHAATRSLIVADLLFNFSPRDSWLTRMLAPLVIGPYPGCRFARMYRPFVLDRRAFRDSIEHILSWDFDRIIVGHGAVVQVDAREAFRSAFRWLVR
jgi:Domain of unknown function (DUF4336)